MARRVLPRALLVCPGRGSYNAAEIGTLGRLPKSSESVWRPLVDAADTRCGGAQLRSISSLDGEPKLSKALHFDPSHASSLIYTLAAAECAALRAEDRWEPIGIVGNSLGWYTAAHLAGCISFERGLDIVLATSSFQRSVGAVGGQIVYPTLDDEWKEGDGELRRRVEAALAAANAKGFASLSIDLGGMAVLAADDKGLAALKENLPAMSRSNVVYPLELPGHSAFHTPLMAPMADHVRALQAAEGPFDLPELPLVDGSGRVWRPGSDRQAAWMPQEMFDYTLGEQIIRPYHFGQSLEIALMEWDPDVIVLLGPGASLGGTIGQVLSRIGWRGVRSKADFTEAQRSDKPLLITSPTARKS
ncbi:hypothetical protein AB1Y20_006621 [Prymnesium parvum]|uniref:Malonyl-CoA:ACP transacylase (MAT) domain-containing protein n=1 Tax=Prymnesium parvum TaxID=97485 RepID=A0AB34IZC6_PRYPA